MKNKKKKMKSNTKQLAFRSVWVVLFFFFSVFFVVWVCFAAVLWWPLSSSSGEGLSLLLLSSLAWIWTFSFLVQCPSVQTSLLFSFLLSSLPWLPFATDGAPPPAGS